MQRLKTKNIKWIKTMRKTSLLSLIVFVGIVIFGVIVFGSFRLIQFFSNFTPKYSAVFLDNVHVYFGKVGKTSSDFVKMTNGYYFYG